MNTKMKTLLFGLLLAVSLGLKAQDKYEYARISDLRGAQIVIVYSGGNQSEKIAIEKVTDFVRYQEQFLQTVERLTDNGWELVTVNEETSGTVYYLKRKKK